MELSLTPPEIRVLANAISWTLGVTFTRSQKPDFTETDLKNLQTVFHALVTAIHNDFNVSVNLTQLRVSQSGTTFAGSIVQKIITCVRCFDAEIGHSPNEVMVVTCQPISVLKELLVQLSGFSI